MKTYESYHPYSDIIRLVPYRLRAIGCFCDLRGRKERTQMGHDPPWMDRQQCPECKRTHNISMASSAGFRGSVKIWCLCGAEYNIDYSTGKLISIHTDPGHASDISDIARRLSGDVRGKITSAGGYFGALSLTAEVEQRFRSSAGGGRATHPEWTKQQLVKLKPVTPERLEHLARCLSRRGQRLAPMQLAALLLERASELAEGQLAELLAREGKK